MIGKLTSGAWLFAIWMVTLEREQAVAAVGCLRVTYPGVKLMKRRGLMSELPHWRFDRFRGAYSALPEWVLPHFARMDFKVSPSPTCTRVLRSISQTFSCSLRAASSAS